MRLGPRRWFLVKTWRSASPHVRPTRMCGRIAAAVRMLASREVNLAQGRGSRVEDCCMQVVSIPLVTGKAMPTEGKTASGG